MRPAYDPLPRRSAARRRAATAGASRVAWVHGTAWRSRQLQDLAGDQGRAVEVVDPFDLVDDGAHVAVIAQVRGDGPQGVTGLDDDAALTGQSQLSVATGQERSEPQSDQ